MRLGMGFPLKADEAQRKSALLAVWMGLLSGNENLAKLNGAQDAVRRAEESVGGGN